MKKSWGRPGADHANTASDGYGLVALVTYLTIDDIAVQTFSVNANSE